MSSATSSTVRLRDPAGEIYNYTKKPLQPKIYALFTLLFAMILLLMILMNVLQAGRTPGKPCSTQAAQHSQIHLGGICNEKRCSLVLAAALTPGLPGRMQPLRHHPSPSAEGAPSATSGGQDVTINVYNWGQYIAEGDDDSIDVIDEFEKAYPNIHVNYTTYDSNETMYSKLKTGGISVDVIIPSDYMIARMIDEHAPAPLNFDNIQPPVCGRSIPEHQLRPGKPVLHPYTWGTVGIIYNTKYVDEADLTGWELLWNEKYSGKILMFGNSRDAFGIAEYLLGYDVNTTDDGEPRLPPKKLKEQKAPGAAVRHG